MGLLLSAVVVLLAFFVVPVPADFYCELDNIQWYCTFGCCFDGYYCCLTAGAIWYAWVLISLFILCCVCGCIACGGYGYRRHYVVRQVHYTQPTTHVITTTTDQYHPYPGKDAPPPYHPANAPPHYGTT